MRVWFLLFILLIQSEAFNANMAEFTAKNHLGGNYVWGGTNPNFGADCSGFVQYVFKQQNINLPRTALSQSQVGQRVDPSQLQKGDLLFFMTDKKRGIPVTHVGMYLENGNFIHAASKKKGIIITPLLEYANRFVVAKRITNSQKIVENVIRFALSIQEQAKRSPTQVKTTMDSLVIINGKYYRIGQF
ncbi:C40 family peptidase [Aquamicrobium sp.]|uniref:C40 family peptidase n=1 Tax=Aquamicrobium sp. TaxID=1872579 RepID=UPI0025896FA2|nr:C40 family peptidase [Aquamicrobium sp.]MCK9550436.1 C40 family peptidase [Aquamicrobium sp.]